MATMNYDPFGPFGNSSGPSNAPNYTAQPPFEMPPPISMTDAQGNLLPQYQVSAGQNVSMDPNIASNPWAQMMSKQVGMQTNQQLDSAANQANQGTANAWSQLAARGGLSAGAKQNVATQGANNAMMTAQGIRNTGAQNQLGVLSNATQQQVALDQANRAANTQANQINTQTQLANTGMGNQYNMNKYNTQMQTWAAGQQANATANQKK